MKNIIAVLFVMLIVISVLTACDPKQSDISSSESGTDTEATVTTAAPVDNTEVNGKVPSGEEGWGEIEPVD